MLKSIVFKFIVTSLFIFPSQVFSQKFDIEFEEQCYIDNSKVLLEILKEVIGEKDIKKILENEKERRSYEYKVNQFQDYFSLYFTLNEDGEIKDFDFIRKANGVLSKKNRKKILKYLAKNKITIKACWNNFYEIGNLNSDLKKKYNDQFKIDFDTIYGNEYTTRVFFPGYLTEELLREYFSSN